MATTPIEINGVDNVQLITNVAPVASIAGAVLTVDFRVTVAQPLASNPGSPVVGQVWLNTVSQRFMAYDGAVRTLAYNPMTDVGDIVYGAVAGAETRLSGNTTTGLQFLASVGTGTVATAPAWTALPIFGTAQDGIVPASGGGTTNFLRADGTWVAPPGGGGSGTVTSVALALPAELTVTGSPVTTAGTLTAVWATESANFVFAGPTTGAAAIPAFRALVAADIPNIAESQVTGLTTDLAAKAPINNPFFTGAVSINAPPTLHSSFEVVGAVTAADATAFVSNVPYASFISAVAVGYITVAGSVFANLNANTSSSGSRNTGLMSYNEDDSTTAGYPGSVWGATCVANATNASGTKLWVIGNEADVYNSGTGAVTSLVGFYTYVQSDATTALMAGFYGGSNYRSSGTAGLNTGVYLQNQSGVANVAANNYQIYSEGTFPFVVRSDGNVGIGTVAPSALLTVQPAVGGPNTAWFGDPYASLSVFGQYFVTQGPTVFAFKNPVSSTAGAQTTATLFYTEDDYASGQLLGFYGVSNSTHATGTKTEVFGLEGEAYNNGAGDVTRLIGVGGYVGQYGTGPSVVTTAASFYSWTNLQSSGSITSNYGLYLESQAGVASVANNNYQIYSATTAPFVVRADGRVGVGLNNPSVPLEVNGSFKLSLGSGGAITFQDGTVQSTSATSGGGLAARTTATVTTASLAASATENDTLTMRKSFSILGISVGNKVCRVRLYSTSAARTADASRAYTVPLALGTQHGCIMDFYFDQVSAVDPWMCSPGIFGFNSDGTPATSIYASITNMATSSQAITLTLTYLPLEI